MTVRIAALRGADMAAALPALARLRIEVFRDWPYLYDGTLEYEQKYLEKFAASEGAVIVAAIDGDDIVGVATGAPMIHHAEEFAAPFEAAGYDITNIFYLGESVLRAIYRGRGIGHAFFDEREAHARSLGGFESVAFCGVIRPSGHPKMPAGYRPLDDFWTKRGYRKMDGMIAEFGWKDIGDSEQTKKPMQFWMRKL